MNKHYLKIDNWYYPLQGIMFRVDAEGDLTMYSVATDAALRLFEDKQAKDIIAVLDRHSIDVAQEMYEEATP